MLGDGFGIGCGIARYVDEVDDSGCVDASGWLMMAMMLSKRRNPATKRRRSEKQNEGKLKIFNKDINSCQIRLGSFFVPSAAKPTCAARAGTGPWTPLIFC